MKEKDKTNVIVLSDRDRDVFLEMLRNPPPPNAALRKAAKKYKEMIAKGELKSE